MAFQTRMLVRNGEYTSVESQVRYDRLKAQGWQDVAAPTPGQRFDRGGLTVEDVINAPALRAAYARAGAIRTDLTTMPSWDPNAADNITAFEEAFAQPNREIMVPPRVVAVSRTVKVPHRRSLVGAGEDSVIRAASGFAANNPVVQLGADGETFTNARASNLKIDANGQPGSVGVYSTAVQETGGLHRVIIVNYLAAGVHIKAVTAENFQLSELFLFGHASATASHGLHLETVKWATVFRVTVDRGADANGVVTASTGSGVRINNAAVELRDIHVEQHATGVQFLTTGHGHASQITGKDLSKLVEIASTAGDLIHLARLYPDPSAAASVVTTLLDSRRSVSLTGMVSSYVAGNQQFAITGSRGLEVRPDADASKGVVARRPSATSTGRLYEAQTEAGVTTWAVLPSGAVRIHGGATASRPSAGTVGAGAQWFDTTLNKPIWSNGTAWVDATGATV